MNELYMICGDSVLLKDVRWIIVDSEETGFLFWKKKEWRVELEYENGEGGLRWYFDSEEAARAVKANIANYLS